MYLITKHYPRFTSYNKGLQIMGVESADEGVYSVNMDYGKINAKTQIRLKITGKLKLEQVKYPRCLCSTGTEPFTSHLITLSRGHLKISLSPCTDD